MIKKVEVLQLADLCKIEISDGEIDKYTGDLNDMLNLVDKIKEVDIDKLEISYNVNNMTNPLREDKVEESIPREQALKNTLEEQYGYFKIINVLD